MGVVRDKLSYLSGTKRLLREAINAVLADRGDPLLTESDPLESYPSALYAGSPPPSAGSLTGSAADKLLRLNETKARLREAINAELGAGLTVGDAFRAYGDEVWAWYFENVIFGAGEQGAWYDPSDLTALYQDSAGTTPVTADGDPVGLMLDKSGNGNYASQSAAAWRPPYGTTSNLNWLAPDGIDDYMDCGDPLSYGSFTVVTALRSEPGGRIIDNRGTGAGGTVPGFFLRSDSIGVDDGNGNIINPIGFSAPISKEVWTMTYDGVAKTLKLRRNGAETISETNPSMGSVLTTLNCRLFASANGTGQRMDGEFYGAIIREGVLSTSEIENAERYFANKSGVQL